VKMVSEIRKSITSGNRHPVIFYETAKRIKATLSVIASIDPSASVSLSREITKLFEETVRGSPSDLAQKDYKGEIVLTVLFSPS